MSFQDLRGLNLKHIRAGSVNKLENRAADRIRIDKAQLSDYGGPLFRGPLKASKLAVVLSCRYDRLTDDL